MVYLNFSWSSSTERYLCYKLSSNISHQTKRTHHVSTKDKLPHSYPTKTHGNKSLNFFLFWVRARACATELTKERSKWRARARGHTAKKIQKLALGDLSIKYFRIRHRHDNHMSKVKLKNEKKPWSLNLETHLYLSIKGNQKTTRKIKNMWPKKLVQTQIHVPTSVCSKNNYVNSCEVVNLLNGQVSTWLPNNRGFEAYKLQIAFVWEPPLKQIYNTHAHTCILQPHK